MDPFFKKIILFCDDIKIQHTIFAMPFAVMSVFLASEGTPSLIRFFWIIIAMIGARTSAMIFNRIVDEKFDKKNPRTRQRVLAAGLIKKKIYYLYLVFFSCIFFYSCSNLNRLSLLLSPFALLIIFFYSYTKRFTIASHFFLGFALSLAPIGGWVAIKEEVSITALLLGGVVVFWLAGLDIIYSCQDVEFDSQNNLWSFPRKFGIKKALQMSGIFHICMVLILLLLFISNRLGLLYLGGVIITAALLWYEHSLVSFDNFKKVNIAFFNINGLLSFFLMLIVVADCYI